MSALSLRIIACGTMLLDHIGFYGGLPALRIIGRIAFPIFAFLIYNGYRHSSHKGRYAMRLLIFAVLSQIPYSLFTRNVILRDRGNVLFTLLLGLLCLWSVDKLLEDKKLRWLSPLPPLGVFALYFFGHIRSDYDAAAVLLVLVFYFFYRRGWSWRLLEGVGVLCAMYYKLLLSWAITVMRLVMGRQAAFPSLETMDIYRIGVVGAVVLILLYNGEKGNLPRWLPPKAVQYGFYLFYPAHQLVIWFLRFGVGVI